LPRLEHRRGDIACLFGHLLRRLSGGRPPATEARLVEALCLHDWPENVRELELTTRRLLAVHGHEPMLKRQHLPPELRKLNDDSAGANRPSQPPRDRREHDLAQIKRVLADNGGNVKATASVLGISRQRIYRLLDGERPSIADPNGEHGSD
jgi:DNA-binding NtrC family response regulator